MPHNASKKGGAKNMNRDRRSSSRQSTPLSMLGDSAPPTPQAVATPTSAVAPTSIPRETAYIHTSTAALVSSDASIDTLIERANGGIGKSSDPPSARDLHALHDKIKETVNKFMVKRGDVCDRSMRQLAQKRKERLAMEREQEAARAAEDAARLKREREEESERERERERKKSKKAQGRKRNADEMDVDVEEEAAAKERRDSLPSVGAHGLARQDGVGVHEGTQAPPSPIISPGRPTMDLMDAAASPPGSDASRAEPLSTAPLYERAFGKDPTRFADPTIYDIRDIHDDLSTDEKRAILNVAQWPESDLHDLTAGDPPDMDFSNAKPATQVNFSTFQTYVEPYIRPFTEEDVAFLKERGDRTTPYVIPQRGARGYKEVWASEDGMDGVAPPRKQESNPNEARGSMEDMNDDTAETDEVSMGPVMSRLLSLIRPTPASSANAASKKDGAGAAEDADGDTTMINGDADPAQESQTVAGASPEDQQQQKPTTLLPLDAPRPTNIPQLDYADIEARAIQELRYIGFLGPNDIQDFNTHNDDEVAARLRTLQHELRLVSRRNNVRKARILELTEERMAMQEYSNIADDLDNQVNAAYLKRNRSLAKPGSKKGGSSHTSRPGGGQKGVAGVGTLGGGRGVSDGVRALMQKRRDWIEMVGPVVGFGRPPIPGDEETVFDEGSMRRLEKVEREAEAGEVEVEAD